MKRIQRTKAKHMQNYLFCKICGDQVDTKYLRSHLCEHNPNADNFSTEEIRDCYQAADPFGDPK